MHHELGLDVLDWFRGERAWASLYELISRLPGEGYYKSALAMDMDYARDLARRQLAGEEIAPVEHDMTPLRYGPVEQRLDLIADGIHRTWSAVVGGATGKAPPVKPLPRPVPALTRAREELVLAELDDITAAVLGGGIPIT